MKPASRTTPNPATPPPAEETVARVRERYASIASGALPSCCGTVVPREEVQLVSADRLGYDTAEVAALPAAADLGLGCGAPIARLALAPGEVVLDLGSGPGLDALLAARRVGPTGRVIGVDMTPAMLERARATAAEAGIDWIDFREGRLEALPVADASVDAVTSNCVINLVPDKEAVFREIARVLRPGGRLVVSDIVLDGALPPVVTQDLLAWAGCIAGAAPRARYFAMLATAGLTQLRILDDFDYIAKLAGTLPAELVQRMATIGVRVEDLAGRVRSVTYEARRPL